MAQRKKSYLFSWEQYRDEACKIAGPGGENKFITNERRAKQ